MKPNSELSIDEFYLSKYLKRAGVDVGDLKATLASAQDKSRKMNHDTQFYVNRAILASEDCQRAIMLALSNLHS